MTNAVASGTGFLFWILVARKYSTDQIGLATSLYSLSNLISSLSLLGFNTGIMRHLPAMEKKNETINSVIIIITLVAIFGSLSVLWGMPFFAKPLLFVRNNNLYSFLFIFFTVLTALNLLSEALFLSFRAALHILIKVIIQNAAKLFLPFFLISLGAFGIFLATSVGTLFAIIYASIIMASYFSVSYAVRIHGSSVKKIAYISLGSYFSGLASIIPSYILPILITSTVSASDAAYYYIVATTVNILFIIPQVITQNLLVESAYNEKEIEIHTRKASRMIALILIPAVVAMVFFGNYILIVFGKQYSTQGIALLQILAISTLISSANYIIGTFLTIYHHVKMLVGINTISAAVILGSSYLLLHNGIIGIGYATIITQLILLVLYCAALYKVKKLHLLRFLI